MVFHGLGYFLSNVKPAFSGLVPRLKIYSLFNSIPALINWTVS